MMDTKELVRQLRGITTTDATLYGVFRQAADRLEALERFKSDHTLDWSKPYTEPEGGH